jgi:hypothetical protein
VLEEVRHAVLLAPLRARARVERGEHGDGARARKAHAMEGKAVGEGGGGDVGHAPSLAGETGVLG